MAENDALVTAGDVTLLRTTDGNGATQYSVKDNASGALTIFTATSGRNIEGDVFTTYENCVRVTPTGIATAIPDEVLRRVDSLFESNPNITNGQATQTASMQAEIRAIRSAAVTLLNQDCDGVRDLGKTRINDTRPLFGR